MNIKRYLIATITLFLGLSLSSVYALNPQPLPPGKSPDTLKSNTLKSNTLKMNSQPSSPASSTLNSGKSPNTLKLNPQPKSTAPTSK